MKNLTFILAIGFLFNLSLANASVEKYELQSSNGKVEFMATGKPAMIRIKGEGRGPEGVVEINGTQVVGQLSMDLQSLGTGIETRDRHMKEKYLEIQKQPTANLKIEKLELPTTAENLDGKSLSLPFKGILKLHGVQSAIEGQLDMTIKGKVAKGTAKFLINITDYQINIPTYAGIKVAEQVDVQVQFAAQSK